MVWMESHLIVDILLKYLGSLRHWCTARVLCRHTHDIVEQMHYDYDLGGSRSMIDTHRCMNCSKYIENPRWIIYKTLPPAYRLYTVVCHHYYCQVSALFSMLKYMQSMNIAVLSTPFQETQDIDIPRSNGNITRGIANIYGLVYINGTPYIMTRWMDGLRCDFSKNIPWSHYFEHSPNIIFKDRQLK